MKKSKCVLLFIFLLQSLILFAQVNKITKQENVIYGMVSGAALLMDIYQPSPSNHMGILVIPGSAYGYVYEDFYGQQELKTDYLQDSNYLGKWAQALAQDGYTVFVINHRFAPAFHAPEIIADCRRAVRFIRFNAGKYAIDSKKIGAFGHSSGASLSAFLGVSDTIIQNTEDPVERVSSKVQAVVTLAAPFDLSDFNKKADTAIDNSFDLKMMESFMGELPPLNEDTFFLSGKYAAASPLAQVSKNAAPMLIYYSDNDPLIPQRQAQNMYRKLRENGVPSKIIMTTQTGHTPLPDMNEVDTWFREYLKE